jgi:ribonuclease HI
MNTAKRLVKHHATLLHDLMHRYKIQPQNMETIEAAHFDMRWTPKVAIKIANNEDEVIMNVNQDSTDVKVFTDGSGMDDKIGAAAVLYRYGRVRSELRYKLGTQHQHTVCKGEGIGMLLGTKLIFNEWGICSASLYIDNRASILAMQLTKPTAGHYIFDAFHEAIETMQKKHNICITIHWIPGHKGVDSNEQADEQAKKAITEESNDKRQLPKLLKKTLPHSKSITK